jgi:hypothetical protein
MVTEIERFESPALTLSFSFMGFDEEQSLQKKGGYNRQIAGSNFGSAACMKEHEDQLRQTTHNLLTQAAKCTEGDGGLSEHLL